MQWVTQKDRKTYKTVKMLTNRYKNMDDNIHMLNRGRENRVSPKTFLTDGHIDGLTFVIIE